VCVCVRVCARVCVCFNKTCPTEFRNHTHLHTATHTFIQPHTHSYSHTHLHTATHTFIQPHTHSYSHTHLHTATHTFIQPHTPDAAGGGEVWDVPQSFVTQLQQFDRLTVSAHICCAVQLCDGNWLVLIHSDCSLFYSCSHTDKTYENLLPWLWNALIFITFCLL